MKKEERMINKKTIALVAHDNRKEDLIEWVKWNWESLYKHNLVCTGTTGKKVEEALLSLLSKKEDIMNLNIIKLKSGPLGGDQQLGSMVSEGKINLMIFLWDPMAAQPHDVDVKALLRITNLYNVPTAYNRSTADYIIESSLFYDPNYKPIVKDYSTYINRKID